MKLNKRQRRALDLMEQVGPLANLRQRTNSTVWVIKGHWPNETRVSLTVMDVHRMRREGIISRGPWGFYLPR